MDEIIDNLYAGSALPVALLFANRRMTPMDMLSDHIDVVINLRNEYQNVLNREPLAHLWFPIIDDAPAPSLEWLRAVVTIVEQFLNAGKKVLVHCAAGVSRSGMVVVALLMRRGQSLNAALSFAQAKRAQINPNPAFMELLRRWEEQC